MNREALQQHLKQHVFFSQLDADYHYLDFFLDCAESLTLDDNHVLFRYGNTADEFYLLINGRVTVEVASLEGPPLELQDLGPDTILGWSWLIPPYRWHFQARTIEPTEVIRFDGKAIRERCETDPRFGYELLKQFSGLMSERLGIARQKMMQEWVPPGFA